ncbi:RagB/SusD family nutrient uptake outer membrane protein [Lutibacter sp. A80]|uniref:RagB/SusD family nutrient uptake outer membrane protein n=1 Tax=Lutibacter sp. A80 TaxID=2918453 RepID=UPI001F056E23|nr:RagB/SusD family nutrient uptake outer membrane protein [Lutibacter sp. A80]UMB60980.1 RagB/SusD family nutrient uptake outer membrane protein [Lutibacter sp. A80]
MKKIIFSTIVILLISVSCSKDFVEIPPVGVLDASTFFNTEENAEQALIGLYDLMQYNYAKDWSSAYFVKMLPGDDVNCGGGSATDQVPLVEINDYVNLSVSNPAVTSVWNLHYRTIALANTIIENVELSELSNKAAVLAEAKFMRAWCYFELTTMWGDVPLRLVNPSELSSEAFAIPKSPRSEIYAQVEADLTEAINGLPTRGALAQDFRVSKASAQALMGKVLVFQEKYSEALNYLESVISNPNYGLAATSEDVWSVDGEFGVESLLEIGFVATNAYDWGNVAWGGRMESNLHVQLMGPRGEFDIAPVGLLNGWGFNYPSAKLISAFESSGENARRSATIMTEQELVDAGGSVNSTDEDGNPVEIYGYDGAIRIKYATKDSDTSEGGIKELNYSVNWRLFRYAEVLFLAAEAYNKTGADDKAIIELNKVRSRAGLDALDNSLSGDALFEAMMQDKFLEFAHEGQRFWDLVRWGKASSELAGTGYTTKNDLFPIPITEIDLNAALTQDDQNPGY